MSPPKAPYDVGNEITDWAPFDSLPFNRPFTMQDYQAYVAKQNGGSVFLTYTIAGRRWWIALGYIASGIILLLAVAAEALFVIR